jgi:hypothetical protein
MPTHGLQTNSAARLLSRENDALLIENALRMLRVGDGSLANALQRDATLKSGNEALSQNLQPPEKGAL